MRDIKIAKNLLLDQTCKNCGVLSKVFQTFPQEARQVFIKYNCECEVDDLAKITASINFTCKNWISWFK